MCLPFLITQLECAIGDLKDNQHKLVQAEKLASMGQMAAGIAHEINNPLGVVLMYSHILKGELEQGGQAKEDVDKIIEEAERTRKIVRSILNFARQEKIERAPADINRLVKSAADQVRSPDDAGNIKVLLDLDKSIGRQLVDKNRFIRMVAHELNSPLAAIINYINVIQSGMFDGKLDKIHEMLERCKIRGEALLELIRDLLFLNKRDSGKVEKSIESLDLKEILAGHLDFFRVQAERTDISLCLEAEKGDFRVKADRGDMERVFVNLISNGLKYNRSSGSLTVRLKQVDHDVIVEIEDTGIGMTDQEMENLFQEFYRVKNEKTVGISGTGLDLATAKRVLAEYNGRIKVESEKGRGTTLTVTLPCNYLRRVS